MLGAYQLVEYNAIKGFTCSCETKTGGYGKVPGKASKCYTDPKMFILMYCILICLFVV